MAYSLDGIRFTPFEKIDGAGNSFSTKEYKYTHEDLVEPQYYYRLTQVDYDGKTTHFPIIVVSTECRIKNEIYLYPNPVDIHDGILNMTFYAELTTSEIEIIDLVGQVVRRVVIDTDSGINSVRLDTKGLPVGTYLIKEKEGKLTERFVIME